MMKKNKIQENKSTFFKINTLKMNDKYLEFHEFPR